MNPTQFAMNMLKNNPNIRNNPNAAEMISAIENNDSTKGVEIANNLLRSYGVSKDQAIQMAKNRFGF